MQTQQIDQQKQKYLEIFLYKKLNQYVILLINKHDALYVYLNLRKILMVRDKTLINQTNELNESPLPH